MVDLLGISIPSTSPLFVALLAIHIPCGVIAVISGVIAMMSKKRPGRHPSFGTIYYWCLAVICASAAMMSIMRWAEDYQLFILGVLSFAAATLGRTAHRRHRSGWIGLHITSMGLSYILMLTAFYVDNGKNLPLWKELPPIAFWLLPSAVGLPLIAYALWRQRRRPKAIGHRPECD